MRGGFPRPPASTTLVSDRYPLKGHYERAQDAALAEALLAALEHSWEVQIDGLGFRAPVPDAVDGPELDFYLVNQDPYYAWTAADAYVDDVVGDGFSGTGAFIVFSRDLPMAEVEVFAAHELNHISQWATDYGEPSINVWEATATAAQAWTWGVDGRWDADVPSFQEVPGAPFLLGDGYVIEPNTGLGGFFEYGAAFWVMELAEQTGLGPELGPVLWDALASEGSNEPDVVDAVAAIAPGGLEGFAHALAVARIAGRVEGTHPSGVAVPVVPEDIGDRWEPRDLFVTGQAFARVTVPEGADQVRIAVDASTSHAITVATEADVFRGTTDVQVNGRVPGETLFLALTALPPEGWDGDDSPWERSDAVVTLAFEAEAPEAPRASCGCRSSGLSDGLWGLLARR